MIISGYLLNEYLKMTKKQTKNIQKKHTSTYTHVLNALVDYRQQFEKCNFECRKLHGSMFKHYNWQII